MEEVKSTAVSTTLYKIDYGFIQAHYLDTEYWKKEWKIFDYAGMTLTLKLKQIDLEENLILIRITAHFAGDREKGLAPLGYGYTGDFWIPISHEEYKDANFQKKLKGCCCDLMGQLERYYIQSGSAYEEMEQWNSDREDAARQEAEDFLDKLGYANKDVREAYIDWYVDKLDPEEQKKADLDSFMKSQEGTILTGYYCIFALYMDDRELCDQYREKAGKDTVGVYEEWVKEKAKFDEETETEYLTSELTDPKEAE
jgi:hypothetical protein